MLSGIVIKWKSSLLHKHYVHQQPMHWFFKKNIYIENISNVNATVIFCRNIDRIFDFSNVRNPFGKRFKSPIFPSNIEYFPSYNSYCTIFI